MTFEDGEMWNKEQLKNRNCTHSTAPCEYDHYELNGFINKYHLFYWIFLPECTILF